MDSEKVFTIDIFPSDHLPEFLVLRSVYEDSMRQLAALLIENKLINKEFSLVSDATKRYKVVDLVNFEDTIFP
jgi:hypothetical protein